VIPTLDEVDHLGDLLLDLGSLTVPHEVLVVDGGSTDGTPQLAREFGAIVVSAPRGADRTPAGAEAASAAVLCFLHADVRLPSETLRMLGELALVRLPCASLSAFPWPPRASVCGWWSSACVSAAVSFGCPMGIRGSW
jgi:glycosyltransferase involved in cell wall biosynthesis